MVGADKRRCVICAAAPVERPAALAGRLREDDYIIAADGGQWLALELGRKPDYLVADFDSARPAAAENLDIPVERLPVMKDDTDSMAAARIGHALGFRDFLLLGASGGRLDHTLANLAVMAWLAGRGCAAAMIDDRVEMTMLGPGSYAIPPAEGAYLSLLPYGGAVTGLTETNVVYPLDNYTLTPDFPLGISNQFTDKPAEITFKTGLLMVFTAKD